MSNVLDTTTDKTGYKVVTEETHPLSICTYLNTKHSKISYYYL